MNKGNVTGLTVVSVLLLVACAAFTAVVATVDMQAIGPNGSVVGLATINGAVFATLGQNELAEKASTVLLGIALLIAVGFLAGAIIQLAKRKSLAAIDRPVILFLSACIALVALYAIFEVVTINYRPILVAGVLKGSYPSSHTMIACGAFGCTAVAAPKLFGGKGAAITCACVIAIIAVTVLRQMSGMHWFTDIVAGFLFAMAVTSFYALGVAKSAPQRQDAKRGKHAR